MALFVCKVGGHEGASSVQTKNFSISINSYNTEQTWSVDLTGYNVDSNGSNLLLGITGITGYGSISSTGATAGLSDFRIDSYNPTTHVATVKGRGRFSASSLNCTATIFVL